MNLEEYRRKLKKEIRVSEDFLKENFDDFKYNNLSYGITQVISSVSESAFDSPQNTIKAANLITSTLLPNDSKLNVTTSWMKNISFFLNLLKK